MHLIDGMHLVDLAGVGAVRAASSAGVADPSAGVAPRPVEVFIEIQRNRPYVCRCTLLLASSLQQKRPKLWIGLRARVGIDGAVERGSPQVSGSRPGRSDSRRALSDKFTLLVVVAIERDGW